MQREPIQDYLRQHGHLTLEQYQHVVGIQFHAKANKYLLQLIRHKPPEYLQGFKDALYASRQERLVSFLP